jgi:hypothetical protein
MWTIAEASRVEEPIARFEKDFTIRVFSSRRFIRNRTAKNPSEAIGIDPIKSKILDLIRVAVRDDINHLWLRKFGGKRGQRFFFAERGMRQENYCEGQDQRFQ